MKKRQEEEIYELDFYICREVVVILKKKQISSIIKPELPYEGCSGLTLWDYSLLFGLLESEVSFLNEAELDAASGEEGDDWLLAFSDDEHVGWTGGEVVAIDVLDVSDVEAAGVLFDVLENTNTTDVVTSDDEDLSTVLILNEALDFSWLKVQLFVYLI
jgi:hypothetical protein